MHEALRVAEKEKEEELFSFLRAVRRLPYYLADADSQLSSLAMNLSHAPVLAMLWVCCGCECSMHEALCVPEKEKELPSAQ